MIKVAERKKIAGLRAKQMGDAWENLFQHSANRAGCRVIKIPSGCRWVSATRAIPVKTPFDFCVIKAGRSVFLDCKTTLTSTWKYSSNDPHQIHWLTECAKGGARAGYLVEFRSLNLVVFFSVEKLASLKARESLKPEQGLCLSGDKGVLNLGLLFYELRDQEAAKTFE